MEQNAAEGGRWQSMVRVNCWRRKGGKGRALPSMFAQLGARSSS